MLGLRLRYQISGFLFLLFSMVVLIMGYFNITILNDQLRRFTLNKAGEDSENIYRLFDATLPNNESSLVNFSQDPLLFQEFLKYIADTEYLYDLQLYDSTGKNVFKYKNSESEIIDDRGIIRKVLRDREPVSQLFAVDLYNEKSQTIEMSGVFDPRLLVVNYYFPVFRKGVTVGILKVSIRLERTSRLMNFFFIGNLSLSIIFIVTAFIAIYVWSENAINKPFRKLLNAQEQLSKGNFDAQVDLNIPSNNEMAIISNSFNEMARELKRYKQELEEKTRKLELLNEQYRILNENLEMEVEDKTRELKEFFSLITHDLKIPLTAIRGYTDLLKKDKTGTLTPKQKKFITAIDSSTLHLLTMVKNMLDSVKYEAGKVEYYMEDFDVTLLLDEIRSRLLPLVEEKSLVMESDIPRECVWINGDRQKIEQVFTNILSNAINYIQKGKEIGIFARDLGESVEFMIKDNGPGIPEDMLAVIFEKFQQIPGKESPSTSLGLGLYIVKKIVEGHGMKTWAESRENQGSTFYFTVRKAVNINLETEN